MASLRSFHLIIFGLMITVMLGCDEMAARRKYSWDASCSAPESYPVKLIVGALYTPEDGFVPLPQSVFTATGWGVASSFDATEDRPTPFPDTLRIIWFSYRERKFYGGDVSLRHIPFQKFFDEGYVDTRTNPPETFHDIRFGLAPGGFISIWVVGSGYSRDIGLVRVGEINYDTTAMLGSVPDIETFVKLAEKEDGRDLSRVDPNHPDAQKWSGQYRRKYSWALKINTRAPLLGAQLHYFDGGIWFLKDSTEQQTTRLAGVLKAVIASWEARDGSKIKGRISFEEAEIFAAFTRLQVPDSAAILTLNLEINQYDNSISAFLSNNTNLIALRKSKTEVWR